MQEPAVSCKSHSTLSMQSLQELSINWFQNDVIKLRDCWSHCSVFLNTDFHPELQIGCVYPCNAFRYCKRCRVCVWERACKNLSVYLHVLLCLRIRACICVYVYMCLCIFKYVGIVYASASAYIAACLCVTSCIQKWSIYESNYII